MLQFIQIEAEGFGSIAEPLCFPLNRGGINIIRGDNGVGKTTLFSALSWCLYGRSLKDITASKIPTWKSKRTSTYQGTRVLVTLFDGVSYYLVARHYKFKGDTLGTKMTDSLVVFKSDSLEFSYGDLSDDQHKADSQLYVNDLLGIDHKTFCTSVLFGQRLNRLVGISGAAKRQLFEELFEVGFVGDAKEKAKATCTKLEKAIANAEHVIQQQGIVISHRQDKIDVCVEVIRNFDTEKLAEVTRITTQIDTATDAVYAAVERRDAKQLEIATAESVEVDTALDQEIAQATGSVSTAQASLDTHTDQLRGLVREIDTSDRNLIAYNKSLGEVVTECTLCGAPINEGDIERIRKEIKGKLAKEDEALAVLKALKASKEEELQPLQDSLKVAQESLKALRQRKNAVATVSIPVLKNQHTNIVREIERLEGTKLTLAASLEQVQSKQPPVYDLDTMRQDIVDAEQLIADNRATIEVNQGLLEKSAWWASTGFASKGLSAYVFNYMLGNLNKYLAVYGKMLGLGIEFSVDMNKVSKPFLTTCIYQGRTVDYEELSGGQKQRVDICVAFAMHDLISTAASLLILDEPFQDLDNEGIEVAFDIIRAKANEGKSIYLITHRNYIDAMGAKEIVISNNGSTNFEV